MRIHKDKKFNFRIVGSCFIFFVAACVLIKTFPIQGSPFESKNKPYYSLAGGMGKAEKNRLVMEHAQELPRYCVGVFGNSRSLMISSQSLNTGSSRFFNFSVGGSSFRHSAYLIEQLAAIGKLPETIVVSLDHVALDYAGLPVQYFSLVDQIWGGVRDFVALTHAPDARKSDFNSLLHGSIRQLAKRLGLFFNLDQIVKKIKYLHAFYLGVPLPELKVIWKPDGSRPVVNTNPLAHNSQVELDPDLRWTELRYPLLEEDLRRISVAAASVNSRVVIYESPLHPGVAEQVEEGLDDLARNIQQRFLSSCQALSITCQLAPRFSIAPQGPFWTDINHAPAEILGPWVSHLISRPE